jgi:hypothetical protein
MQPSGTQRSPEHGAGEYLQEHPGGAIDSVDLSLLPDSGRAQVGRTLREGGPPPYSARNDTRPAA